MHIMVAESNRRPVVRLCYGNCQETALDPQEGLPVGLFWISPCMFIAGWSTRKFTQS